MHRALCLKVTEDIEDKVLEHEIIYTAKLPSEDIRDFEVIVLLGMTTKRGIPVIGVSYSADVHRCDEIHHAFPKNDTWKYEWELDLIPVDDIYICNYTKDADTIKKIRTCHRIGWFDLDELDIERISLDHAITLEGDSSEFKITDNNPEVSDFKRERNRQPLRLPEKPLPEPLLPTHNFKVGDKVNLTLKIGKTLKDVPVIRVEDIMYEEMLTDQNVFLAIDGKEKCYRASFIRKAG